MVGSGSKHAAGGSGLGGGGERRKYPIRAEDYELYEEIGQGVSAIVYRALCRPLGETVAVKVLDFERTNSNLNNIMREAQTMILIDHPNVVKAICSFANNQTLWVVMPYMAGGSCLHIMKSVYPDGFEEAVIATLLREVLRGLEYLHHHGHIHRDVKAGNILVDSRGGVKLGDFGVSACLFESGDRQRARNTFVGTPCWMAPEVMEQLHGYDFKADIWSFGITALELAHGHAPFSKYPPMKVLLMTLQNAPPGLDYERDKKFSRHFKQMVAMCLVKEPSKRPTATKLLKQSFFKQARSHDYIVRKLLEGLPGLGARYQALKEKDEHLLAQKKMPDGRKEEISQVLLVLSCPLLQDMTLDCGVPALHYRGSLIPMEFAAPLELRKLSIELLPCHSALGFIFNELPATLPRLEMLSLSCTQLEGVDSVSRLSKFRSLHHLILNWTISDSARGTTDILDLGCLLEAAPSMEKLELHMVTDHFLHKRYRQEDGELRSLPSCPHSHLSLVHISGFIGEKDQLELALHIIHNATVLEALKIDPWPRTANPVRARVKSENRLANGRSVALEFLCKDDHRSVVSVLEDVGE
ncbi:serine/threonine-protein kinase OSR1 isoform X1 [Triticum aestivum]|uniref:serine/threonine-protein kinase OSR1 isoform X1 n=1 Tax=Triticum aestivum TaxID=4565 RepID=UPI001D00D73A|nr:serine/threonine-protein kinase OSR1-like isoform X1 [Triticum aestivum]